MVAYARGLAKARDNPRVGPKPLIVKGLRTVKARSSDIIISNADAQQIRASAENMTFMKKCRVMVVLD